MSNSGNENVDRAQKTYAAGTTDRDTPPVNVPPKVIIITGGATGVGGPVTDRPVEIRSPDMSLYDPDDKPATQWDGRLDGRFANIVIADENGPISDTKLDEKAEIVITINFQP